MLKNITLSAEESLIKKAREKAEKEHSTLNESFRQWLKQFVSSENRIAEYESLMSEITYAKPGRRFTRDEMNER